MKFKQQKDKFDHCEIASQRTAYIDVKLEESETPPKQYTHTIVLNRTKSYRRNKSFMSFT